MENQSLSQAVPVNRRSYSRLPESLENDVAEGPHEPFTRPGKVPGHLFPTVGRSIEMSASRTYSLSIVSPIPSTHLG